MKKKNTNIQKRFILQLNSQTNNKLKYYDKKLFKQKIDLKSLIENYLI